jgi:hypothetical protein
MIGTWKAADGDLPSITLEADRHARMHSDRDPNDDLTEVWRIEDDRTVVFTLHIPPDPSHEALRDGATEVLRFTLLDRKESSMTIENADGSLHEHYVRVD